MSTIKSSAENLTLNADGANNDIIFQSNGSNVATLDQAGLLTATSFAGSAASLTAIPVTGLRPSAKPIIINGDMQVAQRGTSFSHADAGGNNWTVDRFNINTGSIGVYTSIQESLTSGAAFDAGFKKAARIDCTTAEASPAGGDYFYAEYKIEAQDCLAFKKGTSAAETMTVAFWVKSNKTGTSQLTVKDGDNDRICAGTYAISVANTWEHKVINIAADTTGAFNNDNGAGYIFEWWLGGGTSYTSGTAPTAWEARTDADRGANHLAINDNTANDWAITGIQVEVGTYTAATLPPFQFESYGDNLARCQRYYTKGSISNTGNGSTAYTGGSAMFNPRMRATPTIVVSDDEGNVGKCSADSTDNINAYAYKVSDVYVATSTANVVVGQNVYYNQQFTASAEL